MFGSWKTRTRTPAIASEQSNCKAEFLQQQQHQQRVDKSAAINVFVQQQQQEQHVKKSSAINSRIEFFQKQLLQQQQHHHHREQYRCGGEVAQEHQQHHQERKETPLLFSKIQVSQQQQPQQAECIVTTRNKPQQEDSDDEEEDTGVGYLSEEEELFAVFRARHSQWSSTRTMKDLPGWLKTASLQRCERTPPLPRTKIATVALTTTATALRPAIQKCPLPTPPPRRRRSQSRESFDSQLSVACNSVSQSPTVTPRRRRRQLPVLNGGLMRRSISLQCFDESDKPVLPPKLSIGSRTSLNENEKVGITHL